MKSAISRFSLTPRNGPSPSIRKLVNDNQGVEVRSIKVGRKPIVKGVERLLNVISFGGFGRVKKKLNYDQIYHNYLIVELANGKKIKLEKNHVVEAKDVSDDDYKHEVRSVNMNADNKIDMKELLGNASKNDAGFWKYDAKDKNCQVFTKEVVERNGLQPADSKAAEILDPQDGKALIDSLGALQGVPKVVTDLASGIDRAVYGNGLGGKYGGKLTVKQLFDLANR